MMKNLYLLLFPLLLMNTSCKKGGLGTNALLGKYFETNVLNRNFTESLAQNNGKDLTTNYNGYKLVLLKTDLDQGPLQASKGEIIYTGNWSSNDDYRQLVMDLRGSPAEFDFLNMGWRFTSKKFPTLQLAPLGTSKALVLHMYRQ